MRGQRLSPGRCRPPRFVRELSVLLFAAHAQACADGSQGDLQRLDGGLTSDGSLTVADAGPYSFEAAVDSQVSAPVPLLDHRGWQRYDASLDPLPTHQPVEVVCRESATLYESEAYEIDTTRCNYLLAQHPSELDLPLGSRVQLSLLHYDLTAPEPAEAHLALLFGDSLQWETRVAIPSPANVIDQTFTTSKVLARGEPIRLHLHNHGGNTWLFVSLAALPR